MNEFVPLYEGSTHGVDREGEITNFKRGTILRPMVGTWGYKQFFVYINGKQCLRKVHRVVAQAFIPNPDNLPEINHKNGIKIDNRVENLEWCTRSYNNQHAFDTGLKLPTVMRKGKDNEQSIPVLQMDRIGSIVKRWESLSSTREGGFNVANIHKCCNGKVKSVKGFIWRYAV